MTGLYSEPNFPHKGWREVDCEDLGKGNSEICEACEQQDIRFVHILEHDDYSGQIRVGCICAENLTEDYASKEHEKNAKKRRTFINSPRWKKSRNGNDTIKYEGYRITVFQKESWNFSIANIRENGKPVFGQKQGYSTSEEAKKEAYKKLQLIKTQ